jgi:hypothetical protein
MMAGDLPARATVTKPTPKARFPTLQVPAWETGGSQSEESSSCQLQMCEELCPTMTILTLPVRNKLLDAVHVLLVQLACIKAPLHHPLGQMIEMDRAILNL